MLYVIDSSAVLNDFGFQFSENDSYVTTSLVFSEFRDMRSRHLVDNALRVGLLSIAEPEKQNLDYVESLVACRGFDRLSNADKSVLSLAFGLKKSGGEIVLVTDDYSIQNFCSLLEIPFEPAMRGKIAGELVFSPFCPSCKKSFSPDFKGAVCDVCGSKLSKKGHKVTN